MVALFIAQYSLLVDTTERLSNEMRILGTQPNRAWLPPYEMTAFPSEPTLLPLNPFI